MINRIRRLYRHFFRRHGDQEGDSCNRWGCDGFMEIVWDEPCHCSALGHLAPCVPCERTRLECNLCGFDPDDQGGA